MLQFSLLGSGSGGNAMLVVSPNAKILIDSGLSFRQLQLRTAKLGEDLDGLKAVFVTHEHADHVNGLGTLARRLSVPVFMTPGTLERLPGSVGPLPRVELFEAGDELNVDGIIVRSFSLSHDAADPVSFVVRYGGVQLGLATDLGQVSQLVRQRLAGSHGLVLESNYCPVMLSHGPYPPAIQQRIRGNRGHLSNNDAGALLASLVHDVLKVVVLVHVSEENNTPNLVYERAAQALDGHPARICVALPDAATPLFELMP